MVSEKISILGQFLQEVSVGLILFVGSLVSALFVAIMNLLRSLMVNQMVQLIK